MTYTIKDINRMIGDLGSEGPTSGVAKSNDENNDKKNIGPVVNAKDLVGKSKPLPDQTNMIDKSVLPDEVYNDMIVDPAYTKESIGKLVDTLIEDEQTITVPKKDLQKTTDTLSKSGVSFVIDDDSSDVIKIKFKTSDEKTKASKLLTL